MQRIERINEADASPATQELLAQVRASMGQVPNIVATLAQSRASLAAYLGLSGALAQGSLSAALREQIALACAGANQCDYCASAHSVLGGMSGLSADEIRRNLQGRSEEPRAEAALQLARRIVFKRGELEDQDLEDARSAGFSDEELVEIFSNTVLNLFTNYFNHLARTEIDFPVVTTAEAA